MGVFAPNSAKIRGVLLVLAPILLGQIVIGALIIYLVASGEVKHSLDTTIQRVQEDLRYEDGRWDTANYDTDPEIPGSYRLYVIAKDGFVIDRWRPIPGYLDTSDFKQLSTYTKPRTVETVTNQTWRMLSVPVNNEDGHTVGLVATGRLDPDPDRLGTVDEELQTAAKSLIDKVSVTDSRLDTSNVSVHDVPYNLSFLVVDEFNKIHAKSDNSSSIGRLPNYIDPSYVVEHLRKPVSKRLMGSNHGGTYVVRSVPVTDDHGTPVATIIAARLVNNNVTLFRSYIGFSVLGALLLILPLAFWLLRRQVQQDGSQPAQPVRLNADQIEVIEFNKNGHYIKINDKKIELTYATNQYYMCAALFAAPKKKWETDELLDRIGEEITPDSWRKLYDAMAGINKKTGEIMLAKLIVTSNKTYRINPAIVLKITKKHL